MEERKANISFPKSGNGIGARIVLSVPLLKKLGITQEERAVIVTYDEENGIITIRKEK
ncbi:hypothetical protein HUW86_09910 [Fusobacterium sp. SB021]|uniref:hypothetical protein n=1 Tax=Fusobacterium sp. SB021 TaxID=2744227 RepID=UPI003CF15710